MRENRIEEQYDHGICRIRILDVYLILDEGHKNNSLNNDSKRFESNDSVNSSLTDGMTIGPTIDGKQI